MGGRLSYRVGPPCSPAAIQYGAVADNIRPVPYTDIDTVLLDVGNTLISIDFDRVAAELATRQLPCEPGSLRRAEAAARPGYSEPSARVTSTYR